MRVHVCALMKVREHWRLDVHAVEFACVASCNGSLSFILTCVDVRELVCATVYVRACQLACMHACAGGCL